MRKRSYRKEHLPIILLILLVVGVLIYSQFGSENVLQAPRTVQCASVLPSTISASIRLCGNINLQSPSIITSSNVIVTCAPGTTITKVGSGNFDAITISQNLNNVQINGCTFKGNFRNVIVLNSGVRSSSIQNNIIDGLSSAQTTNGIKENSGAYRNSFMNNNIKNIGYAIITEGYGSVISGNTLHSNKGGVLVGTDPSTIDPSTPNAICSTTQGTFYYPIHCSIPGNGKDIAVNNNQITNNLYGITTYGLDNKIIDNTIYSTTTFTNNREGIRVGSIFAGSEINPGTNQLQEYFSSGVTIKGNTISLNKDAGIILDGRSTYFWQTSAPFSRKSIIEENNINNNGNQNDVYSAGLIIGAEDKLNSANSYFYTWQEITTINKNVFLGNYNDGIQLRSNAYMTDIIFNEIISNMRNGITVGTRRVNSLNPWDYPEFSAHRFIYGNIIDDNIQDGINYPHGYLDYVILNEINRNGNRGIYLSENAWGDPSSAHQVACNDISFNTKEGFNYDAKRINPLHSSNGHYGVSQFILNRVLNNGADGIRYFIEPNMITTLDWFSLMYTWNNHIEGNGFTPNPIYSISGYGINVDGFYYHGFFANNFVNNNLGPSRDSGNLGVENMWDEYQFEKGYDNVVCKCGTPCQGDWECGYYPGTCVSNICQPPPGSGLSCDPVTNTASCYANPNSLSPPYYIAKYYHNYPFPYVPRGNFGSSLTPPIIPLSLAPPLVPTTCVNNGECTTKSCENYPAPINNQQCGNGDFIPEPLQFLGSYQPPLSSFSCPYGYWPPSQGIFIPNPTGGGTQGDPTGGEDSPSERESSDLLDYYPENTPEDVLKDRRYIENQITSSERNVKS